MKKSELPPSYNNEWRDAQGQVFQLCVIHEVRRKESIIAVVDIAGYSVCRECLDRIVAHFIASKGVISLEKAAQTVLEVAIVHANVKTNHA